MTAAGTGLALGLSLTALFLPPFPCAGAPSRSAKKPPRERIPAPAPREPESPITRLREQIKALMADMRVSAEKLQALQKRYPGNKDLDALLPERRAALQEIEERWAELERMEEDFKRMLKIEQAQTVTALLQRFQTGTMPKDESSAPQAEVERLMGIDSFNRVIKEFKTEIGNIRGQENAAWNAERQAIADEKRRIAIACGGAGAFLALILFVRYVRKRRRLATVTVTSVAPTQGYPTPAPGLPGQSSGLLPGPSTPAPYGAGGAEAIGTVIGGNYKILSELGRGGLGIVYEAQDVTLERKVVLRKIREEVHQSEKDIESFLAQARFVAALKHANLTEIYSIFLESERIFMVVEHFPGQPLSRFLDSGNRISLRSVKGVLQQVCAALDYAHANNVLHGDLKPSNIMVNPQGLVKVMDFSIGLQAKKILAKHGWSEARVSPAYMAPEQELGFAAKASDLYSLGICFYELATGRLPFEGPNFLAQKREMRFPPPTQIVAELPKGADLVAQGALQPEPGNRFRSAAEFFSSIAALPG